MPDKSRHGKEKRSSLSKKRRERQRHLAGANPQQIAAEIPKPALTDKVAAKASVPTPSAPPITVQYPYIGAELLRIGILTGIILVILIVLALVLPRV